jgi:TRAP-type C4-dicarboxylate transport system permease small subunit
MEILYFTLAAILLYFAADWILSRIETAAGRRFKYRNLIFFALLLVMALTSFALIQQLADHNGLQDQNKSNDFPALDPDQGTQSSDSVSLHKSFTVTTCRTKITENNRRRSV